MDIGNAYAALTLDIITEYAFAKSYECLGRPDFAAEWPKLIQATSAQSALNKQFPSILKIMKMMPESLVEKLNPEMMLLINFQKVWTIISLRIMAIQQTHEDLGYGKPSNSHSRGQVR